MITQLNIHERNMRRLRNREIFTSANAEETRPLERHTTSNSRETSAGTFPFREDAQRLPKVN